MKNNIDVQLAKIAQQKRIGLMTHVVVGYPTLRATREIVHAMAASDVDFVELQIPFSDPLADGPAIQKACEVSLAQGTKVADAFTIAMQLSSEVHTPLLFMAYFNTVYKYGVKQFCADAKSAGISGLIIPDAPLEAAEHEGLLAACNEHGLHNIITLSPTSSDERLEKNSRIASGFAYCMTHAGTTGVRHDLDPRVVTYLEHVREFVAVPLAAGFGIAKPEHLRTLAFHADVAVIGSALINIVTDSTSENMASNIKAFLQALRKEDGAAK